VSSPAGEGGVEALDPHLLEGGVDEPQAEVDRLLGFVERHQGHVVALAEELEGQLGGASATADVVHRHRREDDHRVEVDRVASLGRGSGGGTGMSPSR
jgi:hypothetical protein